MLPAEALRAPFKPIRRPEIRHRVRLKKSGIKQTDLAEILGVSPQLITDWFKGRKFPVAEETLHLQELMRNPAKSQKRDSLNRL